MFEFMHRRVTALAAAAGFATLLSGVTLSPATAAAPALAVPPQLLPTNLAGTQIYAAPPAGFNALTAADDAIAAYGLPPRPNAVAAPTEYAHWVKLVTHANTLIGDRSLKVVPQIQSGPVKASGRSGSLYYSSNWSGVAETNPKKPFDLVYGYYTVPAVKPPPGAGCSKNTYLGNWVGMDGFSNGDVLQAGTWEFSLGCSTEYYAWYEWFPFSSVAIPGLAIAPGDGIVDEVWYTSSTNQGHAFLENYTTGSYVSVTFSPPKGTVFAGSSAEWILEAPTVGGVQAAFPDYGFGDFAFAYADDTAGNSYDSSDTTTAVHNDIYGVQGGTIYSLEEVIGPAALWFFYE